MKLSLPQDRTITEGVKVCLATVLIIRTASLNQLLFFPALLSDALAAT